MEQRRRGRRPHQSEQCGATRNAEAGTDQNGVEPSGHLQQPAPRRFDPPRTPKGRRPYGRGRAGTRPWPKHRRKPNRRWLVEQREPEPYSGKSEKLAERTQHDEIAAAHITGETEAGWSDIHERLVDHENAAAGTQLWGEGEQRFPFDESAIRVVGIGDDGEIGIAKGGGLARLDDAMAGKTRRARVLVIGRR